MTRAKDPLASSATSRRTLSSLDSSCPHLGQMGCRRSPASPADGGDQSIGVYLCDAVGKAEHPGLVGHR